MAHDIVAPTDRDVQALDHADSHTKAAFQDARDCDAVDRSLTIRQAVKKYKKADWWHYNNSSLAKRLRRLTNTAQSDATRFSCRWCVVSRNHFHSCICTVAGLRGLYVR